MPRLAEAVEKLPIQHHRLSVLPVIGVVNENVHMAAPHAAFIQKGTERVLQKGKIFGSAEGQIQKTKVDRLQFHGDFPTVPPGGATAVAVMLSMGCASFRCNLYYTIL